MARGDTDRQDARQAATATVIARDSFVEGQLTGSRPVRIEGSLKGSVRIEAPLEIAAGAVAEAEVHATVVRVAGTVTGNIAASELVDLLASAFVKGDVVAPALRVVEGARLEGRVQMRSPQAGEVTTP